MTCSQDRLRPDTRRRKCGTWWPRVTTSSGGTGKGKGQGRPTKTTPPWPATWIDTPPGLGRMRPLNKLQHLGIGPQKPPEPDLRETLKTHMASLPTQVQEAVTRLTAPTPASEQDIAIKLKGQPLSSRTCPRRRHIFSRNWTRPNLNTRLSSTRCRSYSRSSMKGSKPLRCFPRTT